MSIDLAYIVPHPPLIIPAVGNGQEDAVQDTTHSLEQMAREIADFAPETIIVTSPHATAYRDWFHISPGTHAHGDMLQFRAFGTDLEVGYDAEFSMALSQLAHERDFPAGTEGERDPGLDHGTYIPLWFIQKLYRDFAAVRIGLSGFDGLTHYHLGQLIAEGAESLQRR